MTKMSYNIKNEILTTEATRKECTCHVPVLVYWAKTGQKNRTYGDLQKRFVNKVLVNWISVR